MSLETRGEIGNRLAALVRDGQELVDDLVQQDEDNWIDDSEVVVYQKWLASVGHVFLLTGGANSSYVLQFREIVNSQRNPAGLMVYVVRRVFGLLLSGLEEWSHGTLQLVEGIVTPAVFDDMLDEAAQEHEAGRVLEAAVVATMVFRLAVKKVALKHELLPRGKTTLDLLDAMTKAGVFNRRQHERLKAGLAVGDGGAKAGWDSVRPEDAAALIETTRKLVAGFL